MLLPGKLTSEDMELEQPLTPKLLVRWLQIFLLEFMAGRAKTLWEQEFVVSLMNTFTQMR